MRRYPGKRGYHNHEPASWPEMPMELEVYFPQSVIASVRKGLQSGTGTIARFMQVGQGRLRRFYSK